MGAFQNIAACYDGLTRGTSLLRQGGKISAISPHHYDVRGLSHFVKLGDIVASDNGDRGMRGEVIRIDRDKVTVAPFRNADHLRVGDTVFNHGLLVCGPDDSWLGRTINALGEPIDGLGPVYSAPRSAGHAGLNEHILSRSRVDEHFRTGVRAIDVFTPLCYGQRFGIFAGSGVGKSTLIAMLTRTSDFDVVVIALVGERSREVREFIEETIGADDLAKCVIVVATGDESAIMRRRAPECALQIAEHFRDGGKRVLLLLDSLTRYAHALRETAISVDEPPIARGYPSSVFTSMPKLLERAGPGGANGGSITAILSVLVDGDDHNDPVADAARGILDGHLVMDRTIADQGRYPPINPLTSISRLSGKVWTTEQRKLVRQLRAMMSSYEETRELRLMGAWNRGADPDVDRAFDLVPILYEALTQHPEDPVSRDPFAELAATLKGDAPANAKHSKAENGETGQPWSGK